VSEQDTTLGLTRTQQIHRQRQYFFPHDELKSWFDAMLEEVEDLWDLAESPIISAS
jgi:hypothetical protein